MADRGRVVSISMKSILSLTNIPCDRYTMVQRLYHPRATSRAQLPANPFSLLGGQLLFVYICNWSISHIFPINSNILTESIQAQVSPLLITSYGSFHFSTNPDLLGSVFTRTSHGWDCQGAFQALSASLIS